MSNQTSIEWADSTFNPWQGCTKVSPACDHCYAERQTARFKAVEWGAGKPRVRTSAANWKLPARWQKQAFWFRSCSQCGWRGDLPRGGACGVCPRCGWAAATNPSRRRVFCASLADWLDNEVPIEWLVDLLDLIRRTPNLDWLLLSKRVGNWSARLTAARNAVNDEPSTDRTEPLLAWLHAWIGPFNVDPPANVWLGATVINQAEADRDVPKLLAVPARVRFLSIEPMLGPISFRWMNAWPENAPTTALSPSGITNHLDGLRRLDWIITGGESGPHARLMSIQWVRELRDQCAAAGVPFLFKQWGEWAPYCDLNDDGSPNESTMGMDRVGKKAAGRQLDGIEHNGFPAPKP